MRLLRYGPIGQEKPGLLDDEGGLRDLSAVVGDITPATLAPAQLGHLRGLDPQSLPKVVGEQRLGAPLTGIGNILGIGLNYADHARETKGEPPPEPILFFKHTGSLTGPFDPIPFPPGAERLDWEAELGVVIGAAAHQVSEAEALSHVAGYMVLHDVSERDYQFKRQGQWGKGKSFPGFCPIGPYLVTADEVPDPQALAIRLSLNGEAMQNSSTEQMIFPVRFLVSYLSRFLRLLPGDVIATGTPAGVGLGRKLFLKPGDVVELSVAGLGTQRQTVTAP
ncbi:fumarylacetoacetate hydrolase family protein [Oleispirillum naphthae]|uniref:fumarylacetoacetate hydrolase family protein n=1 Tax=Oleispirillum naphthae TaxID=2838853 RepID=UPI0030823678